MRLGIIGGRLQGAEAAYLARNAGYEVILLDRDPNVPASALADEFAVVDVVNDYRLASDILRTVDLIIPANENLQTLLETSRLAKEIDRPYAFDPHSYSISSSKKVSNAFFREHNIPLPAQWPEITYPVFIKPSNLSGSIGVRKINTQYQLTEHLTNCGEPLSNFVIEKFIDGMPLSLEVIALNGQALALQITKLEFDDRYDCKRVLAGTPINREMEMTLRDIGCVLAKSLNLTGIMDIEVMLDGCIPRVIEIDARLPSQTPTAVLHSSGINMIKLLVEVFVNGRLPSVNPPTQRAVIYEHVQVSGSHLTVTGEHVLSSAGKLECTENLYGFDRVISDNPLHDSSSWVATLITTGATEREAYLKRQEALARMMTEHNLKHFSDPVPVGNEEMVR